MQGLYVHVNLVTGTFELMHQKNLSVRAVLKILDIFFSLSPNWDDIRSLAVTLRKLHNVAFAAALASIVLPVPVESLQLNIDTMNLLDKKQITWRAIHHESNWW